MSPLDAVMIIECDESATEAEVLAAWASLIASGHVWHLQGSYGRGANRLIDAGLITPEGVVV